MPRLAVISPSANQLVHVGGEVHVQWITVHVSRAKTMRIDLQRHNGSERLSCTAMMYI